MPELQNQLPIRPEYLKQRQISVFPAVRKKLKKAVTLSDGTILKKGTLLLVQPLMEEGNSPNNAKEFNLTVFEEEKSKLDKSLPESERGGITIVATYEREKFPLNALYRREGEIYRNRAMQPLFRKQPSIKDVKQGLIPDCFLLACIQSILNHKDGANFIQGMMRDNQDSTVTVRLFDPETSQPVFISVPKAILGQRWGTLGEHKALWVHMLENAYAALGKRLEHVNGKDTVISSPAGSSIVYNDGGYSAFAMSILTGVRSEKTEYLNPNTSFWRIEENEIQRFKTEIELRMPIPDSHINITLKDKMQYYLEAGNYIGDESEQQAAFRSDYVRYFSFYCHNKDALDAIIKDAPSERKQLEELVDFATKHDEDLVAQFLQKIFNYQYAVDENNQIRGEVSLFGTHYQKQQVVLFEKMQNALENGQLLTASTHATFENEAPGLRPGHAYSVLKIEPVAGDGRTDYYITMRNPWGKVGRVYENDKNGKAPMEDEDADTFVLNLTDFYQHFFAVQFSRSVNDAMRFDALRSELIRDLSTSLSEYSLSTRTDPEVLSIFYSDYRDMESKLISLEKMVISQIPSDILVLINGILSNQNPEEVKKEQIQAFLECESELQMPHYSGDVNARFEYLYRLLKYQYLLQKNDDYAAIKALRNEIIQNATYDFCNVAKNQKAIADAAVLCMYRDMPGDLFTEIDK